MLRIQKPVDMKTGRDIRTLSEKLNETIPANYSIFNEKIDAEELLFLMTNPPEAAQFLNSEENVNIFHIASTHKKVNLEVINNFLNRISAYGTSSFTYQDSVYVSNVLNKLGITDVSEFLKEVGGIRENTQHVKTLIRVYQENLKVFQLAHAAAEQRLQQETESHEQVEGSAPEDRYYLNTKIYKRLNTEKLYDIVARFAHPNQFFQWEIFPSQVAVMEQAKVHEQLKLQQLKEQAGMESPEIPGSSFNRYERHENSSHYQERKNIIASAVAAGLVNLTNSIFVNKTVQELTKQDYWYRMTSAIYQSAENAVQRFSSYDLRSAVNRGAHSLTVEQTNKLYQEELQNLESVQNVLYSIKAAHQRLETREEVYPLESFPQRILVEEGTTTHEEENTVHTVNQFAEQINQIVNSRTEAAAEGETNVYKQLQEINQKNVRIYQKIKDASLQEPKKAPAGRSALDAQRIRRAALEALDHPEQAIQQFFSQVVNPQETIDLVKLYPALESLEPEDRAMTEAALLSRLELREREGSAFEGTAAALNRELNSLQQGRPEAGSADFPHSPAELIGSPVAPMWEEISRQLDESVSQLLKSGSLPKAYEQAAREERQRPQLGENTEKEVLVHKTLEQQSREERQLLEARETVKREVSQVLEPIVKTHLPEIKEAAQGHRSLPMIHKQMNDISDEIFEEINRSQVTRQQEVVNESIVKTETLNKQEINSITRQVTEKTTENIASTIDKTIIGQLDTITEKVYSQLERKLGMERSRRGY